MATDALQSFNVFLTERLSAAALDIYGFVEKTLTDYQEEVNRTKQENQRLQRLLDLRYKPEIRLHRADSRQNDLPTWKPEVCVQEKQIQTECVLKEEPDNIDTLTPVVSVGENEENQMPTQDETGGEHSESEAPHNPTQVITDDRPTDNEERSQGKQQPSSGYAKKKKMFHCNTRSESFLKRKRKGKMDLRLAGHAANGLLKSASAKLVCIECGRKLENNIQMIRHMRYHSDKTTFACFICGKTYKLKSKLQEHMLTHTMEKPYRCDKCGKHFKRSSSLINHVKQAHREDKPYECTQCSQRFKLLIELKRHTRIAHNVTVCGLSTAGLTPLKLKNAKRPTTPQSAEEVQPVQSPSGRQDEPGPSHLKEEHREELWINGCEEQPSPEDSDDDDSLTKELIKTVQQLEDCRAVEESQGMAQATEDDPEPSEEKTSTTLYRCHICNYIFTKKTVLTWHLKTHESKSPDGKGNFDCHVCGKQIPCQSNLQNHMRVHTGERPYSCHFCGKSFKLKGHMTEHIRTHTGEKPFSCHICGKSFNRGSTLRKHVLAKHKEERPYKCEDCDELFTERLLMKTHMRKVHGVKLPTSLSTA